MALFLRQRGIPRKKEDIEVQAESGTVILYGTLPSPDAKRHCLECCRHVAGVIKVIDQFEIESSEGSDGLFPSFRRKAH